MNVKKLGVALALGASLNAEAIELSGVVTDSDGAVLEGAEVSVVGGIASTKTDSSGVFSFSLQSETAELHFTHPGMIHSSEEYDADNSNISVQLSAGLIEQVDVVGVPLHLSALESAHPVTVISGDELREKQASTLGETLRNEVGVHSSYYGGVASSPVIRGLDGPRVLIAQNGLDVGDASRIGPDHVVSAEASTAKQIEILRGPSTLFFGSGAIGGVVNVVDNRVPSDSESSARIFSGYNSVSDEKELSGEFKGGNDNLAFYVDGFVRDADEYEIPSHSEEEHHDEEEEGEEHEEHEEHDEGVLENSASESSGFTIGSSLLFENGFVGLSYGRLERLNGVPGHGHEEEEDHDEEGGEEEGEHEHEEGVESDLKQNRWQLISQFDVNSAWVKSVSARAGYTDYEHEEVEEGGGTTFTNELLQVRTDINHRDVNGWLGALSFEFRDDDLAAVGEEAFTPSSESQTLAFALMEEKHFGDLLVQAGFRIEDVSLDSTIVEPHDHEEEGEEEAHEDETVSLSYTPISLSAGVVWEFAEGYNTSLSITRAERAPNPAEVFSFGPHIGTRTYEIGALYTIEDEGDEYHVEANNSVEKEVSNNIDVSLRKFDGRFGFILNAFYNQISDFYFLDDTGLTSDVLFPEEEEEAEGEEEHAHAEDLPVFIHRQADATLYGFEAQVIAAVTDSFKVTFTGDSVKAELDDGGSLPRIPPARAGVKGEWTSGNWTIGADAMHSFKQDDVAPLETATDSYTLYNAKVSYRIDLESISLSAFLKGENLTDEFAQVHSSFLKEDAPLPGRAYRLGLSVNF